MNRKDIYNNKVNVGVDNEPVFDKNPKLQHIDREELIYSQCEE